MVYKTFLKNGFLFKATLLSNPIAMLLVTGKIFTVYLQQFLLNVSNNCTPMHMFCTFSLPYQFSSHRCISDIWWVEFRKVQLYIVNILSSGFSRFASGESPSIDGASDFLFLRGMGRDLRDCCFS